MSDAYGVIIFTKSNDCLYNVDGIINILRQYDWSQEDAEWEYDEDSGVLFYGNGDVQEPNLFPRRPLTYSVIRGDDEETVIIKAEELLEDDLENGGDIEEEEEVPFDQLVNELSPFIKQGWIEFGCGAHQNTERIYFESMRIDSKNSGTRSRSLVNGGSNSGRMSEDVIAGVLQEIELHVQTSG